jgi:hypothetical protein
MDKTTPKYYQNSTGIIFDEKNVEVSKVEVQKINPEESAFYKQPKKRVDSNEVYNLALIRSALNQLDDVVTIDSMLHARIVNAITILQGIEKDQVEKLNLV